MPKTNRIYKDIMITLEAKTVDYAYPYHSWLDDDGGFYFPDASIQPFIDEAQKVTKGTFENHLATEVNLSPLNRHRLLIPDPKLSWKESCDLVVTAFTNFHPKLGAKATEVIENPDRWQLTKTSIGEAAGSCNPANCETNPKPYAVINYEYDGTINDAVYIAHELGHLIADDFANETGFSCFDGKRHMAEVQAFFTQHILYDYLHKHGDTDLRQAAQSHFVGEITRSLYSLPIAIGALEAEKLAASEQHDIKQIKPIYEAVQEEWLGNRWQEYDKSQQLFDDIMDATKRDSRGISNLHQHSMASIVSTGIFTAGQSMPIQQREIFIDHIFGREGPKDINDILQMGCSETGWDMAEMAKTSIARVIAPFQKFDEKPSPSNQAVLMHGLAP